MRLLSLVVCFYLLGTCMSSKRCPMPEDPENGSFSLGKRENKVGGLVTFSCNAGYDLVGQAKIKCQKSNKQWAAEFPTCVLGVRCPDIDTELENGEVKIEDGEMVVGKIVKFECNRGFFIPNAAQRSIKCLDTGTWSNTVPACEKSSCEVPNVFIRDGFVIDSQNGTYYANDVLYYGCDDGYKLREGNWQVCKPSKGENGGWEGTVPRCEFIRCSKLPELENGRKSGTQSEVGDVVTFDCLSGYTLIGPSQRTCLDNGRWTKGDPVCTRTHNPSDCTPLPIPINGEKQGKRYDSNDIVQFSCYNGYTLIGSDLRQCVDREWTGEQPHCEAPDEYSDLEDVKAAFIKNFDSLKTVTNTNEMVEDEKDRQKAEACEGVPEAECQTGRLIDLNYRGRLEVYFVFDASQSVGSENFATSIRFVKAVVSKLGVGSREKGPRYGIVVYSNEATVVMQTTEPQDSVEAVHQRLDTVQYEGKGTNTNAGLTALLTNLIPLSVRNLPQSDLEPQRAVFLLTDGESNTGGKPYQVADDLRSTYDAKIHCIGISESVNKDELRELASTPTTEYYFHLANYPDLEELAHAIISVEYNYSSCGIGGNNVKSLGKIFGGTKANEGAWPWQVAFYKQSSINNQDLFCGGTLISENWILTAAHCFDLVLTPKKGEDWRETTAYFGMTSLKYDIGSSQSFRLKRLIVHEKYDSTKSPKFDYDIALAELEFPVELNPKVRTACLPAVTNENLNTEYLLENGDVTVTGWGKTEEVSVHPDLQELVIAMQPYAECNKDVAGKYTSRMFCAGGEDGKDACQGDSGGPVVKKFDVNGETRYEVVGVVSWGRGCGVAGQYGYYTHVPKLLQWIKEKTGL